MELFSSKVEYMVDDSPIPDPIELRSSFYMFSDPHKINKKIDVKKLQFGSKIDDEKVEQIKRVAQ